MKNKILLMALLMMAVAGAHAQVLKGTVLLNGNEVRAEYTKLSDNTVALGSGHNACISQYSEGRVSVPGTVTIGGVNYTVTAVSDLAFRLCTRISFVDIQDNVTRIGNFAFVGCSGLKELELPSTLTTIGSGAFINTPLASVKCDADTPPVWEYNDVFMFHEGGISDTNSYQVGSGVILSVPADSQDDYAVAEYSDASLGWTTPDGWGKYFQTFEDAFYNSYRIYSPQDLDHLRDFCNLSEEPYINRGCDIKHVYLEKDIDMSDYTWDNGIGIFGYEFKGSFHGNGHTISNLHVNDTSEDTSNGVGLFGFYNPDTWGEDEACITDLRMKDCSFSSNKNSAGGLMGRMMAATTVKIDKVYFDNVNVHSTTSNAGGLVGTQDYGTLEVTDCALFGTVNGGNYRGSVVGRGKHVNISYSAFGMSVGNTDGNSYASFVGYSDATTNVYDPYKVTADHCYTYEYKNQPEKYFFGDNLVFADDTYHFYLSPSGSMEHHFYDGGYEPMKSFFMVPELGTDHWIYKQDKNPLPHCFTDVWPVEVNQMVIGSPEAAATTVNCLTPAEDIPEEAWRTADFFSNFYHYSFNASRIWIDETIEPDRYKDSYQYYMLPIGDGTINCSDGVDYQRVMSARDVGEQTETVPVYEQDGEGNLVLDDEGNPIETGEYEEISTGIQYSPVGYSIFLPYSMQMPDNCKLYQPKKVERKDVDGTQTTVVTFTQVDDNLAEAFQPYYVVVEEDFITLSNHVSTVCPPLSTISTIDLGSFDFTGTNKYISNTNAGNWGENAYILQSDGKWHKVTKNNYQTVYIPAFRSYFRAKDANSANELTMMLDDATTGVVQIRTIDADGNDRYFDINGRLLPGKPEHGIYIWKGKKYVVK